MTASNCANCGSGLLQLEAWKEGREGGMTLRLRCPECFVRIVGDFDATQVARLDRAVTEARLEMMALYQAVVCENLGHEATLMSRERRAVLQLRRRVRIARLEAREDRGDFLLVH
jgi:hypothetical protein